MHVREVEKRGLRIETNNNGHNLAGFDHFKCGIIAELKRVNYKDLEDMVHGMQITYNEIVDILEVKYIAGSTIGQTLPPMNFQTSDFNLMLKSLLLDDVTVNIKTGDIRLRSILSSNKTIKITKKSLFHTIMGFTQSHSGDLGDIKGFVQLIPGQNKSDKPIMFNGIDKIHLKCDCINGSIVNGIREPVSCQFGLHKPLRHEIEEKLRVKLFKKTKSVLSYTTFNLKHDDHEAVNFKGKTISFTCQLIQF